MSENTTASTTDQPPGFDTGTLPPRPPWWRRKLVIIPASGLALILAASIGAAAAGGGSRTGSASQRPATPAGIYANANQIVQALKAHHVPVTNVVADSGFWSGEGATSGVWATTAPGDSAAVFGGSKNPVQDTEIVVFQNHAKAVAYANLGTDPNAGAPDPDHETILGTNWAVDAATPAAPGLRAALGGTLIPNVPASTAPAAPSAPASQPAAPAPAASQPAAPATTAPAPAAPATTAPAAPATSAPASPAGPTASQQQALDAAQNYLSDGQGFSRASLISQLTSQYGNGFSQADATWAVDHSGANWDAQAVISAKNYMSDGQGFSRASLIDQLTSAYGSQFTYAQAVYAAGQVGL
jgi:hypothetical protein